jgi:hypothetical protein
MLSTIWRRARRLARFAVIPAVAGTVALPAGAVAQTPLPGPVPTVTTQISTFGVGLYRISLGRTNWHLDATRVTWLMDGKPLPERDGKYLFTVLGDELRDGQLHTFTARLPRLDVPGESYDVSAQLRAFKPLVLTAPVQSAASARRRGIAVRVSAARGYYRLRTTSKRIPAAGGVSFDSRNGGQATVRLRGSYLDRIRPGMRLRIHARHLNSGYVLETESVVVRFT